MVQNTDLALDRPEQDKPGPGISGPETESPSKPKGWMRYWKRQTVMPDSSDNSIDGEKEYPPTERWTLGILNDKKTEEVPGECIVSFNV